ncbi:MAG: exosome complex RNA-binding protein Csl4 [Candidatus Micrarchaeia archaeon]|jgi:exosome complex component CSL4
MILPGDFMATVEESLGGEGTFEEDGRVYAAVRGNAVCDVRSRSVAVAAPLIARPLREGDLCYAVVHDLFDMVALLKFQPADFKGVRVASHNSSAFLRISEVQRGYTEDFRDFLRIGDVLRARVKEITSLGIYLTIADNDLGVVRAFCSNCRHEMQLRGRVFVCSNCGNREGRKLALAQARL